MGRRGECNGNGHGFEGIVDLIVVLIVMQFFCSFVND
jgi:hypothetical protein